MERLSNKEVRLGNKVLIDGRICTVDNIYADYIGTTEFPSILDRQAKQVYGVELSAEILEGCGFVKNGEDTDELCFYTLKQLGLWCRRGESNLYTIRAFGNSPVKHLHQLQNLYFSLTGHELNISETVKQ